MSVVAVIDIEKVISKYNREVRKNPPWTKSWNEKMRATKPNEDGARTTLLGSKSFGCEIIYLVSDDTLEVIGFHPKSGGIITKFCEFRAEDGIKYLLGLSAVLGTKKITIKHRIYDDLNFKVFKKYALSYDSENGIFTLDLNDGSLNGLWLKHQEVVKSLKAYKEKDKAFKGEWINFSKNRFKYEYYVSGTKGNIYLGVDDESAGYYLFEDKLEIKIPISKELEKELVDEEVERMLNEIKDQGKLNALLNPSDEIFKDTTKRIIRLEEHYRKQIFDYLIAVYEQGDLDSRLIQKDFDSIINHEYSSHELHFYRFLESYLIYDKKNDDLTFYKDGEEAKSVFVETTVSYYENDMRDMMKEIK